MTQPLTPAAAVHQRAVLADVGEALREFAREMKEIVLKAMAGLRRLWARYTSPLPRRPRYLDQPRSVATQLRRLDRRALRRARHRARRRQRLALV